MGGDEFRQRLACGTRDSPDADLYEADLAGANLRGADLQGADLCRADLHGANLEDAELAGARLAGADLVEADLAGANLATADLNGAVLTGANLQGAGLARADLHGTDLADANLQGADLREADLRQADLKGADLAGANLSGANLAGVDLAGARLPWAQTDGTAPCKDCVLVIEDHDDGRETLRLLLAAFGFRVEVASDGVEGVRKGLELMPPCAVVDIGLPGLDGYEVARQLRAALGDDMLLIAHTAYDSADSRERARQAGFNALLGKPADVEEMARMLRRQA